MQYFESVSYQAHIIVEGYNVILNHYPFLCYPGYKPYTLQLFGHIHSSPYKFEGIDAENAKQHLHPSQYDVGVDWNDFKPVSWREVIEKIKYQKENNVNMYGVK